MPPPFRQKNRYSGNGADVTDYYYVFNVGICTFAWLMIIIYLFILTQDYSALWRFNNHWCHSISQQNNELYF